MQLDPALTGPMNEKIEEYLQKVRDEQEFLMNGWLSFCESPIEQRLGLELAYAQVSCVEDPKPIALSYHDEPIDLENLEKYIPHQYRVRDEHKHLPKGYEHRNNHFYALISQAEILKYRADFLLLYRWRFGGAEIKKIVIECDGHEWHEKTREQAARDRKRDNDLQLLGFDVLRFTGSQIFKDVRWCVSEIMKHVHVECDGVRKALGGKISDRLYR